MLIVKYDMLNEKLHVIHRYFWSSVAQAYLVDYWVIFKKDAAEFRGE